MEGNKKFAMTEEGQNGQAYVKTSTSKPGWSFKEKCLAFFTIVLLGVCIALVVVLVVKFAATDKVSEDNVCSTSECVQQSASLLNSIDKNVNPCEDFFQFSCGQWMRSHVIPDDKNKYNRFGELRDDLQVKLKGLLEEPSASGENAAIKKAKDLYASCMDEELIARRGRDVVRPLLQDLGGWPVLDPLWNPRPFNLVDLLVRLGRYNNKVLIDVTVSTDDKNSSLNVITVDQPSLGMPSRDYYLDQKNAENLAAYRKLTKGAAMMFGADNQTAHRDMDDVVNFEIQLANYTIPDSERRNRTTLYNPVTIGQLMTDIPGFDWLTFIKQLIGRSDLTIDRSETVVVYAPSFLRNIIALVQRTDNRVIANYGIWRIMQNRIGNLAYEDREILRQYEKKVFGTKTERPRWRTCVDYVNNNVGRATGRLFVSRYFDGNAKDSALNMIGFLRASFKELIGKAEWMDATTRRFALIKADAIVQKIGYSDHIMDDAWLENDYKDVSFNRSTYFENVLTCIQDNVVRNSKKLRQPVFKANWTSTAAIVNAFYNPSHNDITFPAGILQPPFYSKDYPKSLIFGGIGMVIGHEITHGFDDEGSQYDERGNLKNWWTTPSLTQFTEKAKCIEDQYSSFSLQGEHVRGKQTLGENIADNGGLKAAFLAYRKWVAANGEEKKLPGMEYTHDQLFFLNFAQGWCSISTPEADRYQLLTDAHSPGRFRVLGSVSNSEYFAQAFNCPSGSNMNPSKKCAVW